MGKKVQGSPEAGLGHPGEFLLAFAFGGLYLAAFLLSDFFPRAHGLLMALWPAGGIGLAAFLSLPRKRWPFLAVLLYALGLGANIATGRPVVASFGFMAANIAESVLSALAVGAFAKTPRILRETRGIAGILFAALAVNAATACVGALSAWLAIGEHFSTFWLNWWIGDGMSILVVTPAVLAFLGPGRRDRAQRGWPEYLAAYALAIGTAWLVFDGTEATRPLPFQPYLVILACAWPAIRFGERGLSAVILAVAAIALTGDTTRLGPSRLGGEGEVERLILVQAFVAVSSVCCWLLRTERAQSDGALRESETSRLFLKGLGDSIPSGFIYHYSVDAEGRRENDYVSEGVERACGESAARVIEDPGLLTRGILPEDKAALETTYAAATAGRTGFQAVYRRKGADGGVRWFLDSARPSVREDGGLDWTGIELDITARESLSASLKESEARFETFFRHSPVPALITRLADGSILDANQAFERAFGHARADILGRSTLDIRLFEDPAERTDIVRKVMVDGKARTAELHLLASDGRSILGETFVAPMRIGPEDYVLSQLRDITEERRTLVDLSERELLLALSQEIAHVGHWIWEPAANRLTWSDEMYRIFGIEPSVAGGGLDLAEVIAKAIHPEDRAAVEAANTRVLAEGKPLPLEYRVVHADGAIRNVWASPGQLERDGTGAVRRLYGIVQDVTERRRELERLEAALEERESLLRELNHRTNNSLQVAIAILASLAMRTKDGEARLLLDQAQERIEAMALVQKRIYEGRDLAHVDLAGIVTGLWEGLAFSRGLPSGKIAPAFRLEPTPVLVDTAIPFALAINELLANVVDHAFPGERRGTLSVTLGKRGDLVVVELSDDGVGVPPGFDPLRDGGLGLEFVTGLCGSQLRGELAFRLEGGFGCSFSFRDNLYEARV